VDYQNALHQSIQERNQNAVKFLLHAGFVTLPTIIDYVTRMNDAWVINQDIVPESMKDEVIRQAFLRDAPAIIRTYLSRGWSAESFVTIRANDSLPALAHAACGNLHDIAALLIEFGADVNFVHDKPTDYLRGFSIEPQTPLYYAAERGYLKTTELLITAGAAVNHVVDAYSLAPTAIHAAALSGKATVVQSLLAAGANPNLRGVTARSPLYLAVQRYFIEVASVLLDGGATIDEFVLTSLRESENFSVAWGLVEKFRLRENGRQVA
jgi:ankyrin repeat protein